MLGGRSARPHASFFCTEWGKGNHRTVAELAPPPDVEQLQPGDFVEAEVELVVFPSRASDYYGPDAVFREALQRDADTWRLVQREAAGNALKPQLVRGTLQRSYPLIVAVVPHEQMAELSLDPGLGHIPVRFTGLTHPRDHELRVNGQLENHWQTDWDPVTHTWQITANVAASEGQRLQLQFGPASE